ncbi:MAG: polysaccharide biosynthesis protein [Flavobacteriaceae bacterium]|jgi:FlaA1/EpsC-like NDP-sugar epimerase|nr:polysaccharide biosynthesis protein [Flavobacteriaceae bacterium]
MLLEDDILKINTQTIRFEELFNKKIDYSPQFFHFLKNKTLLITGGSGSIGTVLIKQLIAQDIHQIIVLDHCEYGIFRLELVFGEEIKNKKLHLILGDIRNSTLIEKIFSLFPIQIVYHAAAYKHINILENNVDESVSVNIEASLNLVRISGQKNIEQFVFISTDKAVNPINKMGISKRITELHLIKQILSGKTNLTIKIIRFGNVFNSSGSVFPIFKYQIENKLPITLTNKEMKRYFISKFQAANGLIQIANPVNGSGIYLLNMGQPLKIGDLLQQLLKKLNLDYTPKILSNPKKTIKYEKIEEELYFPFEEIEEENPNYKNIKLANYNLPKIELEIKNLIHLLKNN